MGLERIVNVVSTELKEVEKLNNAVLSDFHPDIQADFHIPLLLCPLRRTHWQDERENENVCDELIKACSDPKAQESRVLSLISKLQPEALRCWGTLTGSSCEPAVEKEQNHHLPTASGTPSTQDTLHPGHSPHYSKKNTGLRNVEPADIGQKYEKVPRSWGYFSYRGISV